MKTNKMVDNNASNAGMGPVGPIQPEEGVLRSEDLYRALVESTGTGYVIIDEKGYVIDANREYVHLSGHGDLSEIRGRNVLEWTPGYAKEKNEMAVKECFRKGYIRNFEIDYAGPRGTIVHIEIDATVEIVDGTKRILTLCRDITQRKKVEEAVRESEEMFRQLIEGAPDAVFVRTGGAFSYVNSATCRLLGADAAEQLVGSPVLDRIHPESRDLVQKRIRYINKERKPNPTLEIIFLRLDGSTVTAEVSAVPIQFLHKNSALVFARDSSEKRKTEEALRNAQKLESIGVLAGGIAHDFNNLLVGIFGNLDLARIFVAEGNHAEALATLTRGMLVLDRARSLTHQLLTFSKGGAPVQKIISLGPFIRNTTKFALSGSNIECVFLIPPDLRHCNVDENQIGQVIDNIVINAQQAMPAGGTIAITASNVTVGQGVSESGPPPILRDGDYVKISFKDSGIGIPKEILPRIFDPFFTTKQKGSGLGLAITYSIIRRHNGTIEVESEPGKGATFHVFLPASKDKAADEKNAPPVEFKGTGRVLIMDDEQLILTIVSKMVGKMGFSTVTTLNAGEAIRIVKQGKDSGHPVTIAVLDLTIPGGKGGRETVKDLLKIDPAIKAVVSSGYSDDPVMADPKQYGFSARLNKPYTIEEIKEVLRSLL
jgi:PAS domain S-box-containing protein